MIQVSSSILEIAGELDPSAINVFAIVSVALGLSTLPLTLSLSSSIRLRASDSPNRVVKSSRPVNDVSLTIYEERKGKASRMF